VVIPVPEAQEILHLPVSPGNGEAELDGVFPALRPARSARDEFFAGFPVHRPQQAGAAHGDEEVRKVNRNVFGPALPLVRLERLEERVDFLRPMPYRSIRARNPGASSPDRQRAARAGAGACGESK